MEKHPTHPSVGRLAKLPQNFHSSKFDSHSPRNEFEAEPTPVSVTPTSVRVHFDVSTTHPHTPDRCLKSSFTTTINVLNSPPKIPSTVKATSNLFKFEWVCPSSKIDRDKKQIAPPVAVQRGHIQFIVTAISPKVALEIELSSLFDGSGELCHEQLTNYWTDQVTRIKMVKSDDKNFTPPVVDTQGSMAYKCYYHWKSYSHYGIWLNEESKVLIEGKTPSNDRNATPSNDGRKMTELRSCHQLIARGLPLLLRITSLCTFRSIFQTIFCHRCCLPSSLFLFIHGH